MTQQDRLHYAAARGRFPCLILQGKNALKREKGNRTPLSDDQRRRHPPCRVSRFPHPAPTDRDRFTDFSCSMMAHERVYTGSINTATTPIGLLLEIFKPSTLNMNEPQLPRRQYCTVRGWTVKEKGLQLIAQTNCLLDTYTIATLRCNRGRERGSPSSLLPSLSPLARSICADVWRARRFFSVAQAPKPNWRIRFLFGTQWTAGGRGTVVDVVVGTHTQPD
ncbi:hypothetical protein B0H66DRAFT_549243 [Apodospora peruviana]|uniref:Uncharacterized protein n=1 Tax=Apodospora peruviana TaxID=516989 RepID=A0AAE0IIS5_9PEZI|nr:hypothetical protein B0H66DRAFT_549243 [Apodospora peruviana]